MRLVFEDSEFDIRYGLSPCLMFCFNGVSVKIR
ncbi:hypothetical protein ES702_04372 [subsurface metagenome]